MALPGGTQDFPLTLTHVLGRARTVHHGAEVVTLLDGEGNRKRATLAEVAGRADRLAGGLRSLGVKQGDRVGTFAWNSQEHLEAYYAVPCGGAVLHTLNPRLSAEQIAYTMNHAGDRVVHRRRLTGRRDGEGPAPLGETVERFVVIGDGDPGALPGDPLRLRGAAGRAGAGLRVARAGRALGRRPLLHVGHDRQPEGRRSTRTGRCACTCW